MTCGPPSDATLSTSALLLCNGPAISLPVFASAAPPFPPPPLPGTRIDNPATPIPLFRAPPRAGPIALSCYDLNQNPTHVMRLDCLADDGSLGAAAGPDISQTATVGCEYKYSITALARASRFDAFHERCVG